MLNQGNKRDFERFLGFRRNQNLMGLDCHPYSRYIPRGASFFATIKLNKVSRL
jgi:hypothetical protein